MTPCRPPRRFEARRLEPSVAFPYACEGCGYHFRTLANLEDHKAAFDRIAECQPHPADLTRRAA